jgi:acetolactate synthase-1/2/3 large subunit
MRCVLGLFEGVVMGAADGYYRMKGSPMTCFIDQLLDDLRW